ncbi:helix-turn-helix domain-containing protein [Brevundimonas viscosa]|uniref:helix-turn-helix domain-containing protein n=1 Tax=Brevundimonas viscosa TaxID=871741 RepID=UPI003CCBB452
MWLCPDRQSSSGAPAAPCWRSPGAGETRWLGSRGRIHRTLGGRRSRSDAVAGEAGLAMRHLGRIERGEGNPTVAILGRMAEVLDVHPAAFYADHS